MIDIHSHILPGIDDGASDMDETMELLEIAAESGVTDIVATCHCNIPGIYNNYAGEKLSALYDKVVLTAKRSDIPVRIHKGMELYATDDLPDIIRKKIVWTLGGTAYILVEFGFEDDPERCSAVLKKCKDMGYKPIVAHPERYIFIQDDPGIAYEWCTAGYPLQINRDSLMGRFGGRAERTSHELTAHGLAACVASDAHDTEVRNTNMKYIRRYLIQEFGDEFARLLLDINPERILKGRELLGYRPIPF